MVKKFLKDLEFDQFFRFIKDEELVWEMVAVIDIPDGARSLVLRCYTTSGVLPQSSSTPDWPFEPIEIFEDGYYRDMGTFGIRGKKYHKQAHREVGLLTPGDNLLHNNLHWWIEAGFSGNKVRVAPGPDNLNPGYLMHFDTKVEPLWEARLPVGHKPASTPIEWDFPAW